MSSSRLALWAPVAAYMALIFGISAIADPPAPPSAIGDKGGHAVLYFGLGALLVRALAGGWTRAITRRTVFVALAIAVLYGASDELHQYFVPPRRMDAFDLLADALGAALAVSLLYVRAIIRGRHGL